MDAPGGFIFIFACDQMKFELAIFAARLLPEQEKVGVGRNR